MNNNYSPILVSIAIVTMNRKDLLIRAIDSAYSQTYQHIEIILVDNASDDGTVDVISKLFPLVRIIRLHRNIGCQPGRNIAMANCKGKFIFNLDDDGILDPNAIERIVKRFESDHNVGIINCWTPDFELANIAPQKCTSMKERWSGNFQGCAHAIRSSILKETGFFPEFPRAGSESVLAAYVLDCGYEILHLPCAIMYHKPFRQIDKNVMKEHRFFMGWHVLKRAFIFRPWPGCFFHGIWNYFRELLISIRHGCLLAHLSGTLRFLFDLPDIVASRKPVYKDTIKKMAYLNYFFVTDKTTIDNYRNLTKIMIFQKRWEQWQNNKKLNQ